MAYNRGKTPRVKLPNWYQAAVSPLIDPFSFQPPNTPLRPSRALREEGGGGFLPGLGVLAPRQPAAYAADAMPNGPPGPLPPPPTAPLRLSIAEASARLGVSPDTVRRRVKRGMLEATRDNTGKLWVQLPADLAQASPALPKQQAAYAPVRGEPSALVLELRDHVASLRGELERAHAERERLLAMLGQAQEALARRGEGVFARLWSRLFGSAEKTHGN